MAVLVAGIAFFIGMGILYVLRAVCHLLGPLVTGGVMWLITLVANHKMATWD